MPERTRDQVRDSTRDDEAMRQALALARAARRRTPPWPWVGCVLVRDGEVVGAGATGAFRRGDHAEVVALQAAGDRARGATAYVTLEPCDHHGNTPPCTAALLDAGVARVVIALEDPDARVAGRGVARLRAAGIAVTVGVGADDAARDLAPYLHHRRTGRSFVVAKIATSLDGRIAAADGSSQWITSEAARADAHELRADSQAVVVGAGTALADRPALTVRGVTPAPEQAPWRVVIDARGRVPAEGPLFDPAFGPTMVVTTDATAPASLDAWQGAGAKVVTVGPGPSGGVDLAATFAVLGAEGVVQALVEGGGTLLGALLDGGHAQRLVTYVAPLLLGVRGRPGYALDGPPSLAGARRLRLDAVTRLGPDLRVDLDLEREGEEAS
jgi:diaminohydroxyphosphoribosylaminopyrimidine deaminase/5-amino-6-(5-phosphoribosylamino)uracil reductase